MYLKYCRQHRSLWKWQLNVLWDQFWFFFSRSLFALIELYVIYQADALVLFKVKTK